MKAIYWFLTLPMRLLALVGLGSTTTTSAVASPPAAASIATSAMGVVGAILKSFLEGLSICLANPVVFTVMSAVFAGGLWSGIEWDKHKVEAMRARLVAADADAKRSNAEWTRKLGLAVAAKASSDAFAKEQAARADRAEAAAASATHDPPAKQPVKRATVRPASVAPVEKKPTTNWFTDLLKKGAQP